MGQVVCFAVLQPQGHEILGIHGSVTHLLVEGVPVGHFPSVRQARHQDGQARLAEEHLPDVPGFGLDISLRRHFPASGPEFVPVNEEIPVGGVVPLLQNVLELGGEHGKMIEDEVQLQVNALGLQVFDVLPGGHPPVQVVADDGEATVQVRVEQAGQNVKGPEGPPQLRQVQCPGNLRKVSPHAVGVGIEHSA